MTASLNSSRPVNGTVVGGTFNIVAPSPSDGQALPFQVDSAGNLLVNVAVGGGGGTAGVQYVDGVTQATPTGTVALGKNPSNILHAISFDASGNLNVNLAAGSISGGNAAASPTGAAVPASADYTGFNSGGSLIGVSAANPLPVVQTAAVDVSDRAARLLGHVTVDNASIAVTGTFFQATQPVSIAAAVDVSDRAARLLGHVTVDNASLAVTGTFFQATQPVSIAAAVDISDRAARLLGHVTVDNASLAVTGTFFQATQPVSIAAAVDVSDRAARLVGVVYGSQAQQLKQTATNFNLQVELATGGTLYDARQIRALTSADVVTASQAVAASLNATVVFASPQHIIVDSGSTDVTDRAARLVGHVTVDNVSIAVTESGTWTVQPGNTANTTPWLVTARVVGNAGATVDSTAAAGAAPTNALLTSGIFNTTIPAPTAGQALAMQADSTGAIAVSQEGRKTTYRMSVRGFTPVASATAPIFSIQGSATKTVRITRVRVSWSCTTGTALPNDISLQKFSALTGGTTGSTPVGAKNDTNNAAQTAICLQYSAVPTTATVVGGISAVERMTWLTAGVAVNVTPGIDWQFGYLNEQALVLRGTAEFFGIVLAAIGTTPVMSIYIEWTEE